MLKADELVKPSIGTEILKAREEEMAKNTKPAVFNMRCQMLEQGRTDTVVAAAEDLIIRMKVYASGGENELHAHTGEDHSFMILQGSARFYGPDGETTDLGPYQGIMLPKGAFYRFHATGTEPLVMIRVGGPSPKKQKKPYRIAKDGSELRGDSKENRTQPIIFRDGAFFPPTR